MKLQYNARDYVGFKTIVSIYHDGHQISSVIMYDDEAEAYCKNLEKRGYTFGFLPKDVAKAKREYLYKLTK